MSAHQDIELQLMAHSLDVSVEELKGFESLDSETLQTLRQQVESSLRSVGQGVLSKLAAVSKLSPAAVNAQLSEHVFGPVITAGLATRLETKRAVKIAEKLSTGFLADVAAQLSAEDAAVLVSRLPDDLVIAAAKSLSDKGDCLILAGLFLSLPTEHVARLLPHIDARVIGEIGEMIDYQDKFLAALKLLPAAQVPEIISDLNNDLKNRYVAAL